MSLVIPKTWNPDEDFLATDINGNFTAIKNKFSEAAGVGIGDSDIASDAAISGLKLSNAAGKQILEDRIQDLAVSAAKLRSSIGLDPDRAVTTDHIRDFAVTPAKIAADAVVKAKLKILETIVTFTGSVVLAPSNCIVVDLSVTNPFANCVVTNPFDFPNNRPMVCIQKDVTAPTGADVSVIPRLYVDESVANPYLMIHSTENSGGGINLNGYSFYVFSIPTS